MKDTVGFVDGGSGAASSAHITQKSIGANLVAKYGKDLSNQKTVGKLFRNKALELGDKWYLICSKWYQNWLLYVGLEDRDENRPTPQMPDKISNKSLLDTDGKSLRVGLTEDTDYFTIPAELWFYLVEIYSCTSESDTIERFVIDDAVEEESKGFQFKIEVRPLNVTLACSMADNTIVEVMSRQATLEQISERIKQLFNVPSDRQVRLFFKSSEDKFMPVTSSKTETLNSSGFGVNDIIFMDVQNEQGGWSISVDTKKSSSSVPPTAPPLPTSANSSSVFSTRTLGTSGANIGAAPTASSSSQVGVTTRSSAYETSLNSVSYSNRNSGVYRPGLCGLSNLGNTCFMNSSLQCMSNVPILTDYFRTGTYKNEINRTNPLGRKGELAEAYADLINEIWSGQNSYTIPRNFKLQLSRFAPQFTGYQQQDSHELLSFLLDGLHEDLNRIIDKPYVELGSHVGKTDEKFAEESWQDHKKRNDSIIVDTFHGLLKSTLNCLVCNEISIKFDPFCYLSVPLPSKKERHIEVIFVPLDASVRMTKYKLTVVKSATIQDLCASLETFVPSVVKSRMIVCDVFSNKFFKVFENHESVNLIKERDNIYIYELPASPASNEYIKVRLLLREKYSSYSNSYFGLPLFLLVPKLNLTYGQLNQFVMDSLKRFMGENEEINAKLNTSLNVNDEIADDESNSADMYDESTVSSSQTRSSQRLKSKQSRPFSLIICKNENIDYESYHKPALADDVPFELSNRDYPNQSVSIVADFGQNNLSKLFERHMMDFVEHPSCNALLIKKRDVIDLADCFNLYTKTEELSDQDYWYCSKCKEHQLSTKKFDLWSLPKVLVVHLKRFSYTRYHRDKIDTHVDFPLVDLDMSNYLINKNHKTTTKYNLIAVSNHYGSLGGGHYTAYAQNRNDKRWYYFDDSSVSSADETSVCTNAAYMLTYLRKDLHESNQKVSDQMDH